MPEDVTKWLQELGLGQYADAFEESAIEWTVLPELDHEVLKELGVAVPGHRLKILKAVKALDSESAVSISAGKSTPDSPATSTGEAERRQLTVMFCDLADSTALAQSLDPEDLREVNRAYQDACKTAIERYDGYVARYMGDGVLAYFGYPQAHEDDAERAVHAGLSVVDSLRNIRVETQDMELGVRVGIATGPVVVGDLIGDGASQESAVVGQTPNLASRLQSLAAKNAVVIGPGTYDLVGRRFKYEALGAQHLKGIIEPVEAWRVIAPIVAASRFDTTRKAGLTPLVGREDELDLLERRWKRVMGGEGQVVMFSGEPGIGKSRLADALVQRVGSQTRTRLHYQCSPYHTASPLYPLMQEIQRTAGFDDTDTEEQRTSKLEALLTPSGQADEHTIDLMVELSQIPSRARRTLEGKSDEERRAMLLHALVARLEGLAETEPVLVVFEDLHWIDPTSLDLLNLIVDHVRSIKAMVVLTFRPEFMATWTGESHVTLLALSRLSRKESVALVETLVATSTPPDVIEQIARRTNGVPLFLEEVARSVVESQTGDSERIDALSLSIPDSLQASLSARLDRLGEAKQVAQIAAVIGREFPYPLISTIADISNEALDSALEILERTGLIAGQGRPPASTYVFKHALMQDAAYASLLNRTRRLLHERIANTIENDYSAQVEMEPELLAHHFTEAGLCKRSLPYWLQAGQRAVVRCAYAEGITHLQRGLDVAEMLPEGDERTHEEITFRLALGVPLLGKEGAAAQTVEENYRRAYALCEALGESERLYPIIWGLWFHHFLRSELQKAGHLANRLVELGQSTKDEKLRLEGHHCQWATRFVVGDLTLALEHCEKGMDLYRPEEHHALTFVYGGHDPGVCARNVSGIGLWLLGYPERSRERFVSAFALARELGHSATVADALQMIVEISVLQRDVVALEKQATELLELASAEKAFPNQVLARGLLGWVMFQRGDVQQGLEQMREAAGIWLQQGTAWTAVPISLVAECLGHVDKVEEGLALVAEVLRLGQRDEVHWWEAELYRVQGELLTKVPGKASHSERSFAKALAVAGTQKAKSLQLRTAINLARLRRSQGERDASLRLLTPIHDWFTEGFDTPDLKEAKALLEELS